MIAFHNGICDACITKDWKEKLSFSKYDIKKQNQSFDLNTKDSGFMEVNSKEPLKEECNYFLNLIRGKKGNKLPL